MTAKAFLYDDEITKKLIERLLGALADFVSHKQHKNEVPHKEWLNFSINVKKINDGEFSFANASLVITPSAIKALSPKEPQAISGGQSSSSKPKRRSPKGKNKEETCKSSSE